MSIGSTASCCSYSVTSDTVLCPKPCEYAPMDCSDPTKVIIQSILNLAQRYGSTQSDIQAEAMLLCPEITQVQIEFWLARGVKFGVFRRIVRAVGDEPTYMILARMSQFNYQNRQYNRYPCGPDSFWRFKK